MNRIVDFYESNHLLILIVIIISFGIYLVSIKKRNDKITISMDDRKQNNEQSKNVIIKLKTQKQLMGPKTFEYTSTRLTFRKDVIEPMDFDDILIINVLGAQNPDNNGRFKMTKRQIYQTYDNVIKSVAYNRDGNYNYKQTPYSAQLYRVF